MDETTCQIDGFGPLPVKRPGTASELGDLIRQGRDASQALYPIAGQTQMSMGRSPAKSGWAIDLRGLNRVVDFPARDMTITVGAGITLWKLQELVAPENLRLPIDVPEANVATLGGALATNVSGSRRFGFGTLRDYVIGISAVNDDGDEFKAGGRVVKNVAGYDLCKLLVGSLGTLGIITQVTLKLRPQAEEQALVSVPCRPEQVSELLEKLLGSRTRPTILDVLNRRAAQVLYQQVHSPFPEDSWIFLVGYEGNADAVKWQVQHLVKELGANFRMDVRLGFTSRPLNQAMIEWAAWPAAKLTLKASLPSSAVPEFLRTASGEGEQAYLRAHAGNGIVVGHFGRDLTAEAASRILNSWRQLAARAGGAVVITRCPAVWKNDLNVWGPPPRDLDLMRQVKDKFDPRRLFNPGRFLEGL